MKNSIKSIPGLIALLLMLIPQLASAQTNDEWEYGLSIYGWFPDISGTTAFPTGTGSDFTIPIDSILDNLDFTLQGNFEAHNGQWGFGLDMVYMDLGKSRTNYVSGTVGNTPIPADAMAGVGLDVKSLILTGAAYYRFIDENNSTADFIFGARYLKFDQDLSWSISGNLGELQLPGREGGSRVSTGNTDFIFGVRGTIAMGKGSRWFVPYHIDVGTGDSDLTWQGVLGLGYEFEWGQAKLTWRHLEYDLASGGRVSDVDFSGPAIGATFLW